MIRWQTGDQPPGWRLSQSSLDRAGGVLRLHLLAARLVGRAYRVEATRRDGWIGVLLSADATEDSVALEEWLTSAGEARSPAVRADQEDVVEGDAVSLDQLLVAEVYRLSLEAGYTELQLRALYGDR